MWHDVKALNLLTGLLWGLCALASIASVLVWLAHRPAFAISAIRVQGVEGAELRHVNALTIRSTALPLLKGNFFTVNLDAVRGAFETVPWVRRASVRREWPDRLVVAVEEHQPLGTWGEEGALLSTKGDVFVVNLAEAEEDSQLLAFFGPKGSEKEVLARYAELEAWLKPIGRFPVSVDLSARHAWTVALDNGTTIKLGRERGHETMKTLVSRLVQVYPQLRERFRDGIDSLDLRYPNGFAVVAGHERAGQG